MNKTRSNLKTVPPVLRKCFVRSLAPAAHHKALSSTALTTKFVLGKAPSNMHSLQICNVSTTLTTGLTKSIQAFCLYAACSHPFDCRAPPCRKTSQALLVHTLLIAEHHHVERLAKPLSGTRACKPSFCDKMNHTFFATTQETKMSLMC
jgi:hypothetical protein